MDGYILSDKGSKGSSVADRHQGLLTLVLRKWAAFLICVWLPTFCSAIYYFGIATPQYVSEAEFLVRGQSSQSSGMLTSLLMAGSGGSASEDTYAVQDYMMSRDVAQKLRKTGILRDAFGGNGADILARFPRAFGPTDFEHFFRYFQNHVVADLDSTTSVSTLKVRSFSAQDSQRIAEFLLTDSERLVNEMNARQRTNTIQASQKEVEQATQHLRALSAQMADYRNESAMLDPTKQSVPMLEEVASLRAMLTTTQIQLAQILGSTPNSPMIPVYRHRIVALQNQITDSNSGITGSSTSLVPKIAGYDDLMVQRELAEKELTVSATNLQTAKAQADRQMMYLDEITQPNLPDYAEYPRRIVSVSVMFASFLGLYLLGRLLIAGVREHQLV